ncbi:MAG: ROK family protein [Bacteroidetes bacterium]|nr:ROK family protein [Bacteroidota bacterium]
MAQVGNKTLMRELNRSNILNYLRINGPTARTDIVRNIGLSAGAVSDITSELMGLNFIVEESLGKSSGGRKPVFLAINPDVGYVVGIKLMENKLAIAITNFLAEVIETKQVDFKVGAQENNFKEIAKIANDFITEAGLDRGDLQGVGIGLPGIVDVERGVLQHSPIIGWRDVQVEEIMSEIMKVPVYIDNDVNTFTLTELWFGKGLGANHFMTVTIGRGIGLGIVTNGKIYRGQGGAGEIGHTVITPGGKRCDCGKQGCLEAYISDPALVNEAFEQGLITKQDSIKTLANLANSGSVEAEKIISNAGYIFGSTLANLANIFDPEFIIVGGEGLRLGDNFLNGMNKAFLNETMPALRGRTTITIDRLDDTAWARGAAGLILQEIFESPIG